MFIVKNSIFTVETPEELLALLLLLGLPEDAQEGAQEVVTEISVGDSLYYVCTFDANTEVITGAVWDQTGLYFSDFAMSIADLAYPLLLIPEPAPFQLTSLLGYEDRKLCKAEQPA